MKTDSHFYLGALLILTVLLSTGCGKKNNLSLPEADNQTIENQNIVKPENDQDSK
ncbi:MAG: hypothetical protein L3J00_02935 [Thiomicrorhabdus sp.]|nr:hypothetical protein [Thiomicrorhabdus sp.]